MTTKDKKRFHQVLMDHADVGPTPVDRFLEEQSKRRARLAAQSQALKIEKRKRQDAPEEQEVPLWERLVRSVGAKPSTGSFRQRLLDRVEDK